MYRAYLEFFEVAETKRRWNMFNDVPWEALDSSIGSEQKAARIEVFCAEELYLPDYSAGGVELILKQTNAAQATYLSIPIAWAADEWRLITLTYSPTNSALYLEDTDWCLRARLAGLRIVYDPTASVRHRLSATSIPSLVL